MNIPDTCSRESVGLLTAISRLGLSSEVIAEAVQSLLPGTCEILGQWQAADDEAARNAQEESLELSLGAMDEGDSVHLHRISAEGEEIGADIQSEAGFDDLHVSTHGTVPSLQTRAAIPRIFKWSTALCPPKRF